MTVDMRAAMTRHHAPCADHEVVASVNSAAARYDVTNQPQEIPMSTQRVIIFFTACSLLTLSGAVTAFAHPRVVRATPAVGGTVAAVPSEVHQTI